MKQKINGWDVLENELNKVSGVEKIIAELFGDGFEISQRRGSDNNDAYCVNGDKISTKTNLVHFRNLMFGFFNVKFFIPRPKWNWTIFIWYIFEIQIKTPLSLSYYIGKIPLKSSYISGIFLCYALLGIL